MYTHFKKCPGTHKLGPLYVVDSVARKYLDLAKKSQQLVSADAPDGTYGAGVYRITELLPTLMNDILQHAPPEENKVRYLPEKTHKFYGDPWSILWLSNRCQAIYYITNIHFGNDREA